MDLGSVGSGAHNNAQIWPDEDLYQNPRDVPSRWHQSQERATSRLEDLERVAGRIYPGNSFKSRFPLRFVWRYTYLFRRSAFPVLQTLSMASHPRLHDRSFDSSRRFQTIVPENGTDQDWSVTAPNPQYPTPTQQTIERATILHSLDDVWANTNPNHNSPSLLNLPSNQVANSFNSFLNSPSAMGQATNQPLTFAELDEYNFLLNEQADDTPDHPVPERTINSRQFSPPTRPISNRSWTSGDTTVTDLTYFQTRRFVDLTADSSPPLMPAQVAQRNVPLLQPSRDSSSSPLNPSKRRKTATGAVRGGAAAAALEPHPRVKIEEVDLRDVDEDTGLSQLLQKQRESTIKAQQEQEGKPTKLANLQCIICMEPMVNITATHCGKSPPRPMTLSVAI